LESRYTIFIATWKERFVEISKNLTRYKSKNNYVRLSN